MASGDDQKMRSELEMELKTEEELSAKEQEMALLTLLFEKQQEPEELKDKLLKMSRSRLAQGILSLFTRLCAHDEHSDELIRKIDRLEDSIASSSCDSCECLHDNLVESHELCDALHRKVGKLRDSCSRLRCGLVYWKSRALAPCLDCVALHRKNDELCSLLACARSEHELLEKNLTSSLDQLEHAKALIVASHVDLDVARDEIALLHSVASLPDDVDDHAMLDKDDLDMLLACDFEHDHLHNNFLSSFDTIEHAKALLDVLHDNHDAARHEVSLVHSIASLPCVCCDSLNAKFDELKFVHNTCVADLEHARAEIDKMRCKPSCCSFADVACQTSCASDSLHDVDASSGVISCTSCFDLKVEVMALEILRDDMSAELVAHKDMSANLEKEVDLLRTTYAECIEKEMENLRNAPCGTCDRLKYQNEVLVTTCKGLCAQFLGSHTSLHSAAGFSSPLPPELDSHVESESMDKSTCGVAKDSSSIASPKPCVESGDVQGNSHGNGATSIFGTQIPKPKFKCTFCKNDGHTFDFCFRRVKHERRVRAKAFRKSRGFSHGTSIPSAGTKFQASAPCAKSQGISHLSENGVPPSRPLYHCTFCERDGHQDSFCYRRAKCIRRARVSRPLDVHCPSHGMNTCEPSEKQCASSSEVSQGTCVGEPQKTLDGHCFFLGGDSRFPRVSPVRHNSKDVLKTILNPHLHHANPRIIIHASRDHVAKSWVPKYILANPSGSKTRASSSSLL